MRLKKKQRIDQKMATLTYDAVNLKELCKSIEDIERERKVFITEYDLLPNIYSDQQFAKDVLNSMDEQE